MDPLVEENGATSEPDDFEFVYQGPDVEEGSMRTKELAEVLVGLTRAFSAVAQEAEINEPFDLRMKDIQPGSVRLLFQAIEWTKANPIPATALAAGASAIAANASVLLNAATNTISGMYRVVTDLAKLIDAKKRVKGQRVATLPASFQENGLVVLTASPDDFVELSREQYELLLSQRVDRSLSKIMSPLALKHIDTFQIKRGDTELARVELAQRDYFDYLEVSEERSKEGTEIVGILNSLTKTSLRGTLHTHDGIHVPYKYVGGDIQKLLRGFAARELLKVIGKIKYGSDGIPKFVEISDIEFVQANFFPR